MPFTANFGTVSGALPDQTYVFRIAQAEIRTSQAGNPGLNVKLVVMQPEEYIDRVVWANFPLLEQSLWKLKAFLEAVLQKDFTDMDEELEFDENELVGLFVRGTTFTSKFNGRERSEVREFFPDL